MDDVRIGRYLRALRRRRGLFQRQVAELAGVSQSAISLTERGHLAALSIRTLRRIFAVVDARFDGMVTWRGGAIDRLLDEVHAALVEAVVRMLTNLGWRVAIEVTFNHFGDRGAVDALGFHASSQCAVVVEVKSEITAAEETNRRLDVKVRLAPALVEREFGARPVAVGRILVLPRSPTAWRRVEQLRATFAAALPGRTTEARQWLRRPRGRFAGVMFVSASNPRGTRSSVQSARRERRA